MGAEGVDVRTLTERKTRPVSALYLRAQNRTPVMPPQPHKKAGDLSIARPSRGLPFLGASSPLEFLFTYVGTGLFRL